MRIGILFTGVGTEFVGGAERFFADFYDIYNKQEKPENKLFFITNHQSLDIFTNKLKKLNYKKNIFLIPNFSNRFKNKLESISFLSKMILKRIDIVHIGSYGNQYFHLLKSIQTLPKFLRPKIVVNIVDCEIPYVLNDPGSTKYKGYQSKYGPLFGKIQIDAIYSWYLLFKEFAESQHSIKSKPYIEAVKTRFSDTTRFFPAINKKNEIVYAARLTSQKRPLFFLEAVKILKNSFEKDIAGWSFLIYGKGPLEEEVKNYIQENKLNNIVSLCATSDLSEVFAKTKCFVSTQDYENFPSLSMCEAMAAGNTIIARNVGQTDYFVKHERNGFLLETDSSVGLAQTLYRYISNPLLHEQMQNESMRLTKEVHTSENFIKDIDQFWEKVKQF
jgi:glycosyltransferase involved in cell wall biosynthesis